LARKNAEKSGYENVEFLEGKIDDIPLPDGTADLVISNCVINLAPDKKAVFREIYRILKPGGRVAVSDIALKQELPSDLAQSAAALVGCIAGAISISDYEQGLREAGFSDVAVIDSGADLTAYAAVEDSESCCAPSSCCGAPSSKPMHQDLKEILEKYDVNAYAASVRVLAKR
jgi:SAM-dependent methyltransferase